MKFLKLHCNGREMLVNIDTIAEIYDMPDEKKSILYLNFELNGIENGIELREQARIKVDESLDEIYQKLNKVSLVI